MAVSIRRMEFDGMDAVEILTSKARLIVVTSMGPRIAHFGTRNGRNLLFWDFIRKYKRGEWRLMGGHRVWATRPLADEAEETYADDNEVCSVRATATGVDIKGAVHPVFRTRKSIGIKVLADDTLQVDSRITNESEMVWSGGVWGLTATLPTANTSYGIPLGREGAWDIFLIGYPKRWAGAQNSRVNDPAVRLTEDCMIIRPKGQISKRMVQAPQGIIGMTDPGEKISFLKQSQFVDGADYPMGCNLAYYSGKKNFMVEMETMGATQGVLPGATLVLRETWMLRKPVDWGKLKGVYKVG
ncbi:MAG: hypothetical protein JWP91_2966 [Fibrobacteres bacterium]|nr:hypothetical protein [Fibrobacterota bacterium]